LTELEKSGTIVALKTKNGTLWRLKNS
jgi:hypothetical protein